MNVPPSMKLSKGVIAGCCVAFIIIPADWIGLLTYLGEPLSAILPRLVLAVVGFGSFLGFAIWNSGRPKKELCLRTSYDIERGAVPAMAAKAEAAPSEIVLRLPKKPPNQ